MSAILSNTDLSRMAEEAELADELFGTPARASTQAVATRSRPSLAMSQNSSMSLDGVGPAHEQHQPGPTGQPAHVGFRGTPARYARLRVTFDSMVAIYNLSPELRDEAHRILESLNPGDEFAATLAYIAICTSIITDHYRLQRANQPWVPTDAMREHARRRGGIIMLDPRVEAYGAVRDANRRVIEFSFEHMMVAHYQGLPHTFTDNQMPEGWGGEDGARAARVFLSFLKEIMKYLRSGLRTNLLTHVLPENGSPPEFAIPTLKQLIGILSRIYLNRNDLQSDDQIFSGLPAAQKLRIAFMRRVAVREYAHPNANRRKSQWTAIDEKLACLAGKSSEYCRMFYRIIMRQDADWFNGINTYVELEGETDFALPTDHDIAEAMAMGAPDREGEGA